MNSVTNFQVVLEASTTPIQLVVFLDVLLNYLVGDPMEVHTSYRFLPPIHVQHRAVAVFQCMWETSKSGLALY